MIRRFILSIAVVTFAAPALGESPTPRQGLPNPEPQVSPIDKPPEGEQKPAEDEKPDEKKKKKEDTWFAVVNGRVRTITGPSYENATVLCRNGDVFAIGADVKLPEKCETLDARGMFVYPGLVAAGAGG
ncbi:MAG: hypothetical protein KDA32_01030, partial [Phycisphaerales bacterium]|nr:hypothetical protein [Phycisphaerales bacterium]